VSRLFIALLVLVSCGGSGDTNGQDVLAEGDRAPSFSLTSADGGKVQLSDYVGKNPVLLYFSMGPG
jgi:peroxiredoxin